MKTKKERNALKEKEVETESKEPRKLTEEELEQVTGGGPINGIGLEANLKSNDVHLPPK